MIIIMYRNKLLHCMVKNTGISEICSVEIKVKKRKKYNSATTPVTYSNVSFNNDIAVTITFMKTTMSMYLSIFSVFFSFSLFVACPDNCKTCDDTSCMACKDGYRDVQGTCTSKGLSLLNFKGTQHTA